MSAPPQEGGLSVEEELAQQLKKSELQRQQSKALMESMGDLLGEPLPEPAGAQGEPVDKGCKETAPNSGICTREWSKADVKMDCNKWEPTITMK